MLARFRADEVVGAVKGGIDAKATRAQFEHIATIIPPKWLAASATGSAERCAAAVAAQFDLGVTGVIMRGATPAELVPVVAAYRKIRPAGLSVLPANPGRSA